MKNYKKVIKKLIHFFTNTVWMTVEDFSIKKVEAKSKNCQNYFLDCVSDFKCKLRRLKASSRGLVVKAEDS